LSLRAEAAMRQRAERLRRDGFGRSAPSRRAFRRLAAPSGRLLPANRRFASSAGVPASAWLAGVWLHA